MKEGKVSIAVLVVIIVISLIGGAAIGILITKLSEKNTPIVTGVQEPEKMQQQAQPTATVPTPTPTATQTIAKVDNDEQKQNPQVTTLNYNEVESISANGKEYKVGVINCVDNSNYIISEIYVNGNFVKTYKYHKFEEDTFDPNADRIELKTISSEDGTNYIIVVFKTKGSTYTDEYICVINAEGEFIGSIKVYNEAEGVATIDMQNGVRYIINSDSITVFKRFHAKNKNNIDYGAIKENIKVFNNEIITGYERIYTEPDEAVLAGK